MCLKKLRGGKVRLAPSLVKREKCRFRSAVSRILSPTPGGVAGHSFIYPAGAGSPPERSATYPESSSGPPDSLFCLAPDWVYPAFIVTFEAVSSYPTFSPLPFANQRFAPGGIFSVTLSVPTGFPAGPPLSRGILPYGVRTFLSSWRSSECPHSEIDPERLPCGSRQRKREFPLGNEGPRGAQQNSFRNWVGANPVMRLKDRLNWEIESNPVSKAISLTRRCGFCRRFLAFSTRTRAR